ncbi:trigger factor [Clostridia bacterium]|nr:trigger factor [Clostridia bacterium]
MANYELLDDNRIKLSFSATKEEFEAALENAYKREKNRINVPGFRKGKLTRKMIELRFGADYFHPSAIQNLLQTLYPAACESVPDDVFLASRPEINILDASDGVSLEATVHLYPVVTLSGYREFTYKPDDSAEITDERIQEEIDLEREKNARIFTVEEARPTKHGDSLIIDYRGTVDGVPFPGGEAKEFEITIGSKHLIPGFEEQLIGHNLQEEFDISVKFPENYHSDELSGKDAVFHIRIDEIREKVFPDMDDDFAQEVSDFETFSEYREEVRKRLQENADLKAKQFRDSQVIYDFSNSFEVDIPEAVLEYAVDDETDSLIGQLRYHGMTLADYCNRMGLDRSSLRTILEPRARDSVKLKTGLYAIAKAENLTATDDEVNERLRNAAKSEVGVTQEKIEEFIANALKNHDFVQETRLKILLTKANELICEAAKPDPDKILPEGEDFGQDDYEDDYEDYDE